MNRWVPPIAIVLAGVVGVWRDLIALRPIALLPLALALVLAWWFSPLRGRRGVRHREVAARPQDFPVVVYWRPGCMYCIRLRSTLGRVGRRATWISIWADEDAAAYVRSVNDGNETVPTVRIGEQVLTNPDPSVVRTALG